MIKELIAAPSYSLDAGEKRAIMVRELSALTEHHRARCDLYRRALEGLFDAPVLGEGEGLAAVPFLPVSLFKTHRLRSVPETAVVKTMTSSGTTGQAVSRIDLDAETATLQQAALVSIFQHFLGKQRLPMIIVDSKSVVSNRATFSARGAGILGMMNFGRDHLFALDDSMNLDAAALGAFLAKWSGKPLLMFGFTFMVWQHLYEACADGAFDLSQATLIHSGGWKKLADRAVSPTEFRARLRQRFGLERSHNFYGMVEQTGSVFVEKDDGRFLPPNFADVIIRDPSTFRELPPGQPGVIQVLSLLPRSYPGHSLLTEDLGVMHDPTTRAFSVLGRLPQAELRGCSDTHAQELEHAHERRGRP